MFAYNCPSAAVVSSLTKGEADLTKGDADRRNERGVDAVIPVEPLTPTELVDDREIISETDGIFNCTDMTLGVQVEVLTRDHKLAKQMLTQGHTPIHHHPPT